MENENIIDFKTWTVPTKWEDISLKKFQEIERFYENKEEKFDVREVIHIICDKTIDEVNALPSEFLDIILEKLLFLQEQPKIDKPSNKIVIDGEEYIINFQNKLKTGEYLAADMAIKGDKHNYAGILAILCRKEGEIYDSKFENEIVEERIKLFEKQPVTKILPLISFFMNCYMILETPSQLFSKVEEEINLTLNNIETLGKNGEISKHFMRSVMKKLKKLKKSIKFT